MEDIFISHSSLDKIGIVEPLVTKLKQQNISVWYDKDSIHDGDIIKNEIIDGIKESLLLVMIISPHFMNSCWTSLELGIKLYNENGNAVIPIFYNIVPSSIANKYPFLLNHKYIIATENIDDVVKQISNAINQIKNETGYFDIQKTKLTELVKKLHSYNAIKLDKLAIKLSNVIKEIKFEMLSAVSNACLINDIILTDIADSEQLYYDEKDNIFNVVDKSGILNSNIQEHFKLIYQLRQQLIGKFSRHCDATLEDIYLFQVSLYSIVDYYVSTYFRQPIIKSIDIVGVPPDQITYDDMVEAYNIETLVLPPDLIAGPEMTKIWYEHNPLTILGARDNATGKLVGFIHTLPMTDEVFEKIKSGCFDDTAFSTADVLQYNIPGIYKLYLSSFCIHPKYHGNINVFKYIYNAFINMLITLAQEHEIFISEIVADGATPKGAALCESIGMKKYISSIHNTNVYYAALIPPSISTVKLNSRQGQMLIKVYNEYREYY